MPKRRKTRKDKMLLDQKRQTVHESTPSVVSSPQTETHQQKEESVATGSMTFSLPETQHKTSEVAQKPKAVTETITVSTNEYGYLSNDLMRTALLTGAIVFAELVIKLFIVH
jgi:hypothetical protein